MEATIKELLTPIMLLFKLLFLITSAILVLISEILLYIVKICTNIIEKLNKLSKLLKDDISESLKQK